MKAKYYLGAVLMAILGATIALFAYTRIIEKPAAVLTRNDSAAITQQAVSPVLTSYPLQDPQPVDLTYAAEITVPAVVHVHIKTTVGGEANNPILQWFYGDRYSRPREVSGYGSGVIISPDGYIITNNHVVEDADNIEVVLNDNRTFPAKLIGRDPNTDIALLKINATNLSFIKYGDSDQLKLGEWVLAVGNPFNLTSTVTAGIVSAKGRDLDILDSNYKIESFIQTDAALNVGNSGGALVNTRGLLVGITSAIVSPNGTYAGNSFAIPVNLVKKVVADLKEYGEVQRAIIGVNIKPITEDIAKKNKYDGLQGVVIGSVVPGGSADAAGLRENDIVTKFDGIQVNSPSELQEQVGEHRPGDKATITYVRNGKENTVSITLKNIAGTTGLVTAEMDEGPIVLGARLETLSPSERDNYNVDSGVKVTEIGNGKLKDIGIRKGYIILSINGKKIKDASDVRNAVGGDKNLKSIEGIQSDGTLFSYSYRN